MSNKKDWVPNLKDTTVSLYEGDVYLGFTIHIDHHWATGDGRAIDLHPSA